MKLLGYSFQDIWNYIETSEKNLDSLLKIKKLTSFCSSISIKLIQSEAYSKALDICEKGIEVSKVTSQTSQALKLWPGRILAFNIKSYLLYKLSNPTESLRSLFESQLLLQTTKESVRPFCIELYILTNFLTYMCLWKINRKKESLKYLEIIKINLTSIRKSKTLSKLPNVSIDNLYGLVHYSQSLLKISLEGNYKSAKLILESILPELGEEILSRSLINTLLSNIKKIEQNPNCALEFELVKEFEDIFFISIFLPMLSPGVPNVRVVNDGSKRSLSRKKEVCKKSLLGAVTAQDVYQPKGSSFKHSPSSRMRLGVRDESPCLRMMRPRSSNGTYIQKKLTRFV